jgi:hypothetical protein
MARNDTVEAAPSYEERKQALLKMPASQEEVVIERREVIARIKLHEGDFADDGRDALHEAFAMCAGYMGYQASPEGGSSGCRLEFKLGDFVYVVESDPRQA